MEIRSSSGFHPYDASDRKTFKSALCHLLCTFTEEAVSCGPAHEALNESADFWPQARHGWQRRIFFLHRLAT